MKRASYRNAVDFIAMNDEVDCLEVEQVQGFISTQLVADLFGVPTERVARDIVRLREKEMDAAKAKLERAFGAVCEIADQ